MSQNQVNPYNIDPHIAELYDQQENRSDDVRLLLQLIGDRECLRILEPFCGTGRILIPLVLAGHQLTGLDQSDVLLSRCKEKLEQVNKSTELIQGDAVTSPWPGGFDLVVLAGNCLYELASIEEQEHCIQAAANALNPGGFLFLDNDHMEGSLAKEWQDVTPRPCFPSGLCADGVRLESSMQTTWFNAPSRSIRFLRKTKTVFPDGRIMQQEYIQQKHPVSATEVRGWLDRNGFQILAHYGTRAGQSYTETSPRAIFWAKKV
jgi:SAM-dependent methyltransferase